MNINFLLPIEIKGIIPERKELSHAIIEIDATVIQDGDFDYNYIKYCGVDLLPLLDNISQAGELMDYFAGEVMERANRKLQAV